MRDLVYDPSEYNAGLPVGVNEVDALLAQDGKPIAKDARKTVHFLLRVKNTIDSLTMDLAHMRRRVDDLSMDRSRRGTPTTLSPMDALKYASQEEIEAIVDRISRQNLQTLRKMVSDANATHAELSAMVLALRSGVAAAVADGTITAEAAERLVKLVPEHIPQVHHQHVLADGFFTEEDLAWEERNAEPTPRRPLVAPAVLETAPVDMDTEVVDTPSSPVEEAPESEIPKTRLPAAREVDLADLPAPEFEMKAPEFTPEDPFTQPEPEPGGWADDIEIEEVTAPVTVNPLAGLGAEADLSAFFPQRDDPFAMPETVAPTADSSPADDLAGGLFGESDSLHDLFEDKD